MSFNIREYRETRDVVINKIKVIHKNWEENEGFIKDGLICPETYAKEKLKIICILTESYGYSQNKDSIDIEDQVETDVLGVNHHQRQTSKKVPALLWLIYESLKRGNKIPRNDFPKLLRKSEANKLMLQEALRKSAWINVKKASKHIDNFGGGATKQNYNEIYEHSLKNKEVLKLQIDSTKPDLIIVFGDPSFDSLMKTRLLGEGIKTKRKKQMQINNLGQMVIQVNHPGYFRDWGYDGIYKTFENIYEGILRNKAQ